MPWRIVVALYVIYSCIDLQCEMDAAYGDDDVMSDVSFQLRHSWHFEIAAPHALLGASFIKLNNACRHSAH